MNGLLMLEGRDAMKEEQTFDELWPEGLLRHVVTAPSQYDASCRAMAGEIIRLRADQQDWRKGVALIASALGDPAENLSCSRIAEMALTSRAEQEELIADLQAENAALRDNNIAVKALFDERARQSVDPVRD